MHRILIVDPVPRTGKFIALTLGAAADIAFAESAQSAAEAVAKLNSQAFDVVLVNCHLPDDEALHLTRTLMRTKQTIKVVVTEVEPSAAVVLHWVEQGAAGYVRAGALLAELSSTLRAILANQFVVSPALAGALIARLADLKRQVRSHCAQVGCELHDEPPALTGRECEVLSFIAQGLSNQAIADQLGITLGTVKVYVHHILRKLAVPNRYQAVRIARRAWPHGAWF